MSAEEYQQASDRRRSRGAFGSWAVVMLVAGIIPCTAPLVLLGGGVFYLVQRDQVRTARPFSRMLARLGLGIAAVWVLVAIAVWIFTGRTQG